MNDKQMDLFRTVCFLVLMQHGKGLISKSPNYIREKIKACKTPFSAWRSLDFDNQTKVHEWAGYCGFPISDCLYSISEGASP